jgi:hypothetical protein
MPSAELQQVAAGQLPPSSFLVPLYLMDTMDVDVLGSAFALNVGDTAIDVRRKRVCVMYCLGVLNMPRRADILYFT